LQGVDKQAETKDGRHFIPVQISNPKGNNMCFFIITDSKTDATEIDTPVFALPGGKVETAVAIFLSCITAEDYIEAAGWKGNHQAAMVAPTEALKWLILASKQGVSHVVVDPCRLKQLQGELLDVIPLIDAQETYAELLRRASEAVCEIEI